MAIRTLTAGAGIALTESVPGATLTVAARLYFVSLADYLDAGTYTQAWQSAVASGAVAIFITASGTITAQINIPAGMSVHGCGYSVAKGFNGDMFNVGSGAIIHNLFLQGSGATFTGRGFVINSGSDQKLLDCGANDMDSYCLEYTTNDTGTRSEVRGGGTTWQRRVSPATNAAIRLPAGDSISVGGRSFINIYCGGGKLIDLNGGNVTYIIGCNGGVDFNANCRAAMLMGNRTGALNIDGAGIILFGNEIGAAVTVAATTQVLVADGNNIAGSVTLNAGCVEVNWGPSNEQTSIIDNSTGTTNKVCFESRRVSADNGDLAKTLTYGSNETTQRWATPLTAPRAVTLSTTSAVNGAHFHIVRTAAATGASTLDVGTGPLKSLAVSQWCDVEYQGAAWMLTGFGSL